jgi:Flp pilus assembly protein TadG
MRAFVSLLSRFRSDERGVFLAVFGLLAIVLVAMSGAVVDYVSLQQARTRAQVALDAAALALQPQIYTKTPEQLRKLAENFLLERLGGASEGWSLCTNPKVQPCTNVSKAVTDIDNGKLTLTANLDVPLYFVALVGVTHIAAGLQSEATRGAMNLEVALALDITGSMAGTKIETLKDAAQDLVNTVIQDVQTPVYSKVAVIPYSNSVNLSTYAAQVRGPVRGPTAITAAGWSNATFNISAATKANPVVITTSAAHNLLTGDYVYISNVSGMTQLNAPATPYRVVWKSNTTFSLTNNAGTNINSSTYGTFTTATTGTVRRCIIATCDVVFTSAAHGLTNGENVYITGMNGLTFFNGVDTWIVGNSTANTFSINSNYGPNINQTYTSGGSAYCVKLGCELYRFQNPSNAWLRYQVTNCASERTANAYNDAAPSTTYLGYVYTPSSGPCVASVIKPLTTDKAGLVAAIETYSAVGSTSGHIGAAWAWYMLSPEFAYLWPTASQPSSYTKPNVLKVAVFMTDGDFNTPYCSGVVAKDAGSGAPAAAQRINCNAPNGTSAAQALELCKAMKAKGILLFTVGFQVSTAAGAMLTQCATDSSHAFLATNGAALKKAFQDIGKNLTSLRISK